MFTTYEGYAIIAVVLMMIGIGALIINKVVTIDI